MTLKQHFQIEFYKLKRPDFYIYAFIVVASFLLIPLVEKFITGKGVSMVSLIKAGGLVGNVLVIYGLIVALTREFYNNAVRKRILNGYSRQDLFISQLVIVALYIGSIVLAILVVIPIHWLVGGMSYAEYTAGMAFYKVIGSFLTLVCYGIFGSFLGVITGKAHWAILVYWGWGILEIPGGFLDMYNVSQGNPEVYKYFMPLSMFSKVQSYQLQEVGLLVALVLFLALFQGLSLFKFLKADF